MHWILSNKEWLFSGLGLAIILWTGRAARKGYQRWAGSAVARPAGGLRAGAHEPGVKAPAKAWLPRFILRARLSPGDLQAALRITLRGASPIGLYLQGPIPHVDIYLEVTNMGPLDLVLNSLALEVWFGQPAFRTTSIRRELVLAGKVTTLTAIRHYVTAEQKAYIEAHDKPGTHGPLRVEVEAYFDSPLGDIAVSEGIELPKA
jgi:hypothetical protein